MPTPPRWRVNRLKWSIAGVTNGTWGDEPNGVDDIPCVRVTDFDRTRFSVIDAPPTLRAVGKSERSGRLLRKGDLLIEKSGGGYNQPVGYVVDFNHTFEAVCSNFIGRIAVAPGMCSRYWTYVHATLYSIRLNVPAIKQTTGIQNLDTDVYFNQKVPFPPLPQQRAIADYLDRETERLDALVAAKERVLALLAEKRRALITHAITHGLDPDVPLRDSGVHWIGEIPAHWEVWKLGHFASVGNGSTPSRGNAAYWTAGRIPWLNSSVVNQYEATKADQFVTDLALRECHLPLVKGGSVLIAITGQGKTRGQAVVLSFEATINQHLAYISPEHSRLNPWFLRWTLLSAYSFLRSISDNTGGTKGALTCEDVANIRVPVPPIYEQCATVAYIAKETSKLDELRTATEKITTLLRERRTALVAEAVTGLIDVERAA